MTSTTISQKQAGRPALAGERMIAVNLSLPPSALALLREEYGKFIGVDKPTALVRVALAAYFARIAEQTTDPEHQARCADVEAALVLASLEPGEAQDYLAQRKVRQQFEIPKRREEDAA